MKQYDPQMHTTEHILNQTMIQMFDCGRSFSMHLERKKSKCDYRFNRSLTADEEGEIARRVNEVIGRHLDVTEEVVDIESVDKLVNLDKLPDDAGDSIRLIRVGDYDVCACIGQHAQNTSEIGTFIITTSSYDDGVLRIRFKLDRP